MRQTSTIRVVILAGVLLWILGTCKNRDEAQAGPVAETAVDSTCYLFLQARDSIKLSIFEQDGKIRGILKFSFYEKDKSTGTLEGEMKGDTLFATYSFMSEGTLSYREVAFLNKGDSFILGSGGMGNISDTNVSDQGDIEFDGGVILKNTDCKRMF